MRKRRRHRPSGTLPPLGQLTVASTGAARATRELQLPQHAKEQSWDTCLRGHIVQCLQSVRTDSQRMLGRLRRDVLSRTLVDLPKSTPPNDHRTRRRRATSAGHRRRRRTSAAQNGPVSMVQTRARAAAAGPAVASSTEASALADLDMWSPAPSPCPCPCHHVLCLYSSSC